MSTSSAASPICPSCDSPEVSMFYEALGAPVNSVLLLPSREEALSFGTGDVRLGFCDACGFIFNSAFDRRLVEYSERCEETQGFSPFFRSWHEQLASRLIDRYALRGKEIVEIGCGKGEFLTLLCELGGNHGVGFDPAYIAERTAPDAASRIRFIADFYTEKDSSLRADFFCCKMTLEHIPDTGAFTGIVRSSLETSPEANVFFQVPDVSRVLEDEAFWDIYYEHCSYFSAGSLSRLFRKQGFDVLNVGREYNGQYITIEARRANGTASPLVAEENVADLKVQVARFADHVPRRIAEWREGLETYRAKGLKAVIWGAGSKGVTFLSVINVPGAIAYAVDVNPHMAGHYMARTGIEIVTPDALRSYRPDVVIVMNPVYRKEIGDELNGLGLAPEVITA